MEITNFGRKVPNLNLHEIKVTFCEFTVRMSPKKKLINLGEKWENFDNSDIIYREKNLTENSFTLNRPVRFYIISILYYDANHYRQLQNGTDLILRKL